MNILQSAISERDSEDSSKDPPSPLLLTDKTLGMSGRVPRRSQSFDAIDKSPKVSTEKKKNERKRQQVDNDGDSQDSESTFSLESLSDRSDLNAEEVDRLVRRYYQRQTLSWVNLSFWEKAKLFKAWYIVSLTGNLCSIFGSLFVIFSGYFELGFGETFIGLGAFCTWCSISKYLANTEDFYIIQRTFKEAIPTIIKVWIGILPIYIGICFLSISVLWEFEESFGGFESGFYTMFSVQAGDALFDTYHAMTLANFFYAQFFMYIFIFFVISIVQNIFMVIVEDSYISIKYAKNFDWLSSGAPMVKNGPGEAPGGGGAPPPPNQTSGVLPVMPENVKKHFTQMGVRPESL